MESNWIKVFLLLCLIGLNGIFAMSELALVASRRVRLQIFQEEGRRGASAAIELQGDPTRALSTIQVGITSIGILSGIVGQDALAVPVAAFLVSIGMGTDTAAAVSIAFVVIVITYVSIILGELVPKRLGQSDPEGVACRVSGPLKILSVAMTPFVKLLSVSTALVMRLFGPGNSSQEGVTEAEITAMVEEGSETGAIEESERDMVRNVFRLDDRQVGSIMTPRSDIEWIDTEDDPDENFQKVMSSKRTRLVVATGSLDNVLGACSTRHLLKQIVEHGKLDFSTGLDQVVYVPESLSGMELLDLFKKSDPSTVLVVDEFGSLVGLVTLRDTLESIAGEFEPAKGEETSAELHGDGSWHLDGIIPVPELKDTLGIKSLPGEDDATYNTLSGMIMLLLERMPRKGDAVEVDGWRLEVAEMDGRRIDKVLAVPLRADRSGTPA